MSFRIVQSKQNARLKRLRQALAHPPRPGREAAQERPLLGLEGPNLLAEALRAHLTLDCVFLAEGSEPLLDEMALPDGVEVLLLPRALLDDALTTEAPQPVAALVEPPQWEWADLAPAGRAPLLLVLAGLQDPGNLGTILRSAEAFGATGVLALPGTVSPWNPKALRASAGSAFRLPYRAANVDEAFQFLSRQKISCLTTAVANALPAPQANLAQPVALILGNEGNGVPAEIAARAQQSITIPCPGPVESLNASIAASILLYEASRQRSAR